MKVIALIGSPRKRGNSDILADEALRGARQAGADTEKVYLDDLNIRPIAEVSDVRPERVDVRKDDDFPGLMERFLDADIAVFSTPIYFGGVSAQLKCFMDRLGGYKFLPEFEKRFGGRGYIALCTFATKKQDYGKWVTEPVKHFAELTKGKYLGDVCVAVYKKGQVMEMSEVLKKAFELGKDAVREIEQSPGT